MNLYDRNIETLARYYPGMDKLIEQYKNESDSDLKIFEDVNIDGEKITKIRWKQTTKLACKDMETSFRKLKKKYTGFYFWSW